MAVARACPRASSRSRQSFPVAERATPRKACGASTGNADAGSVMILRYVGTCRVVRKYRAPGAVQRASDALQNRGPSTESVGPGSAAHREERCAASGTRELTPHLVGYPTEILGHDLPIVLGLEIVFLQ